MSLDKKLSLLESRIDALSAASKKIHKKNQSLKDKEQDLIKKNELAKSKVEDMIHKLKALDKA